MERPEESGTGYPEEQPAEVTDDQPQPPSEDKPQRRGGAAGREPPGSGNEDEGTATGNPHAAGS